MVELTGQLHSRNLRKQQTKFDPQHVLILDLYWCWFDRDIQKVSALTRGLKPHFMANSPVLKNVNTTAAIVLRGFFFFLYWTVFPLVVNFSISVLVCFDLLWRGIVGGVAVGEADTPELHWFITLPLHIKLLNWFLTGLLLLVCRR